MREILKNAWLRLLTGDRLRKTRLHTYSGSLIDVRGLSYLPLSLWSVFLLKLFGYHLRAPWLGYRAVKHLRKLIRPDWRVLEFGSGMSTLLLVRACAHVVSVESDLNWYNQTREILARDGIENIDYRFRDTGSYNSHPDLSPHHFDLIVIDGIARDESAKLAIQLVRPGGYVFYDNSDVPWEDHKTARELLVAAAEPNGVTTFIDFCPFQIQVNESILVRIAARRPAQGMPGE